MRYGRWIWVVLLMLVVGCSGGSSDGGAVGDGGGSTTNPSVSFTPDSPSPGPDTISLSQQSVSGSSATLSVGVTDTNDIYGAAFDVTFDASVMEFTSWAPGTLLETGGHSVSYLVDQPVAGRLVITATRTGNAPEVNAVGTKALMRLTFRATATGTATVAFENGALQDSQPQDLPGLAWSGGALSAL